MEPDRFGGGDNFRCWQNKVRFWLMSMGLWWMIHPVMSFTVEQITAFPTSCDSTIACILTLLAHNLYDIYINYTDSTELWDSLERKYVVSEANRLLHSYKQLFDFSNDGAKSII